METYEMPITAEESKNYHNFLMNLKVLSFRDWVRAYISTITYVFIFFMMLMIMSRQYVLVFWFGTPVYIKIAMFLIFFVTAAMQRSKTVQLRALLMKYFTSSMPKEFLSGQFQMKKIKVLTDRLVVYYRRL